MLLTIQQHVAFRTYASYLRELNPKPIAYEAIALPIELR